MRWVNPWKETVPVKGQIIAVLYAHPKENVPMSYQIMFGEVEWNEDMSCCFACSNDDTGLGSWGVNIWYKEDYEYKGLHEEAVAWMPQENFILPDFLRRKND